MKEEDEAAAVEADWKESISIHLKKNQNPTMSFAFLDFLEASQSPSKSGLFEVKIIKCGNTLVSLLPW